MVLILISIIDIGEVWEALNHCLKDVFQNTVEGFCWKCNASSSWFITNLLFQTDTNLDLKITIMNWNSC